MTCPRKSPALAWVLASLFLAGAVEPVRAQDQKPKGFEYAKDKKTKEPVKGVEVVPGEEEVRPVKVWMIETAGLPSVRKRHLVPVLESVTLYSNGRMRWAFFIKNEREQDDGIAIDFGRSYLIDPRSESYPERAQSVATDPNGRARVECRGGTKTRFWLEFDAPRKAEGKFKVFLSTYNLYINAFIDTDTNEFPAFIVSLKEPISAKLAEPASPRDKPGPGDPPVKYEPDLAQAMRDLAKNSRRFEGAWVTAKGVKESIAVAFLPDPDDEEGAIAHITPVRSPLSKIILQGWIMPDVTTPSGLVIKMKGPSMTYRFSLNVKGLSGSDNKGGKYTLLPVGKGPG